MRFNQTFNIENKKVGINAPTFLIAEIGRNHNGDIELAKDMVEAAAKAGADAVKFQSFRARELLIENLPKASHIEETGEAAKSAFELTKEVELKPEYHKTLKEYAKSKGVTFLSTPEDHGMVALLEDIDVPAFKIASLDIVYLDLIQAIAKTGKPVILSTGMSFLGEVEKALSILHNEGIKDVVVLHCTSNYPPRYEDINLNAMNTIARCFDVPVGYSDHTPGIGVSIGAVALGACVIERHFTLDKNLPGPDQRLSLIPSEFKQMADEIRCMEKARGSSQKKPVEAELEMRRLHRRRLVASGDIANGSVLKRSDIACKCSEFGLEPEYIPFLIGKRICRSMAKDTPFHFDSLFSENAHE